MSLKSRFSQINLLTCSVLIVYPLLVIAGLIAYCINYGAGLFEISMAIIAYYMANISVGVGLHRLWSHSAYKTNKYVEFILMMLSSGTLQGPIIAWASDHDKHHSYTDEAMDPHSPLKYQNKLIGFLWSHIGWMLVGESSYKHISKSAIKRLGKNKIIMFQLKYYWQLATFMNLFLPLIIGFAIGGTIQSAICAYLFIGIGRALQQQMTFCVNSACHFLGTHKYVNNTSGDIPWMFFLLLGENWHNFHHAFPRDYRNGWKSSQLDVHKWIIYIMSKCGLAWDLVKTSEERIYAKQKETCLQITNSANEKLSLIEATAIRIAENARRYISNAEKSTIHVTDSFKKNLSYLEKKADKLVKKVRMAMQDAMKHAEDFEYDKFLSKAMKKLKKLESLSLNLGLSL